jgi:hypothetical protein
MVELERLERVQQSGKYPNLITSTDVDNVKKITEANPSLFAYSWSDKRSTRKDSGVNFSKKSDGTTLYGFWFKTQSGTGTYRLWDGHIIHNNLLNYSFDIIGYFFNADDMNCPEEEHITLDSIPLFEPSIASLCSLVTEITGNQSVGDLKRALDSVKNIDDLTELDYTINYLRINRKKQTIEIGLEKSENDISFSPLVEKVTSEGTLARTNCSAVSDLIEGDFVREDGDNETTILIKCGPEGLYEETSFVISTTWSKLAPSGTSSKDNYKVFQQRSASHANFVSNSSDICTRNRWLDTHIKNEIITWEDDDLLETVYGVTILTVSALGTDTEIIYGYSGVKGGNAPHS